MKRYLFKKLTTRLVTTFAMLAIPGALLVGITSYTLSRNALEASVYAKLETITNLKEMEFRRWIQIKKSSIERIANTRFIRDQVKLVRVPESQNVGNVLDAYEMLAEQLAYFRLSEIDFREVFLLTWDEARVFLSTEKSHEGDYRISDSYFIEGREKTFIQNVFLSPVISMPSIVVSTPLKSNFGENLAVLAAHVDLDRMDQILFSSMGLGQTGEIYLVDKNSNFVSGRRFENQNFPRGLHSTGIDAATSGESGFGLYSNHVQKPVIGVYHWLDDLDMAFIAEIHQSEAFGPARRLGWSLFLLGMGVAAIVLLGSFLVSKKIVHPILMIRDAAALVAKGDLQAKAPVVTGDEVGMLAASFNEMTEQLELLYSALHASEEHFRTVYQLSPDAISVIRMSDETFVDINEGFTNITGFGREDILGHSTRTAGVWVDDEARENFLDELVLKEHIDKQHVNFFRKDGSTFIGSISARKVELSGEFHRISVIRDVTKLRVAEDELRKANALLETQMELSMSGILVVDERGNIVSYNNRYLEMWDIPTEALRSGSDEQVVLAILDKITDPDAFQENRKTLMRNKETLYEGEILLRDGRIFEEYVAPMQDEENRHYGWVIYFRDATESRRSEENLRASVKEKEILLQEIHHRVKNNLQVISGLLDLQSYHITDARGKEIYKESQNRVITMALIHEELYQARDLAQVDYGAYIRNLAKNLFNSYAIDPGKIKLNIRAENVQMVVDTAIPCALIINELVTNSFKHAFPNGREGEVKIVFRQMEEGRYHLEVSDDGVGMSGDLDILKSSSLGLQLVTVLVQQLAGEMKIDLDKGISFVIEFDEYREAGTKMF